VSRPIDWLWPQRLALGNWALVDGVRRSNKLALCCVRCNQIKGAATGEEFASLLKLIASWEGRT
jgi:hypothetical protein